jgi:hypothetical protein
MMKRILASLALACAANAGAFNIPIAVPVIEYVNETTGHYRLTVGGNAGYDEGANGWVRTGHAFTQYTSQHDDSPVCEFYSPLHDAYFYTPYAAECEFLKRPGTGWTYRGYTFTSPPPEATGCPQPRIAVRRLFDGGSNHRFSADPAIIAKMLQRGWVDEGIGFCAHAAGLEPERRFDAYFSSGPMPQSECEARVGPCIALAQLTPMRTRIPPYLPPAYLGPNPAYPPMLDIVGVTGQDLWTSRTGDANDIRQHSFFTNNGAIHLVGNDRDRLSGPYAGLHPMYQLPRLETPFDERAFPWRNGRERDLVVTSTLSVTTLTRGNASSHAYGLPLIQFTDRGSGRSFYVTLQAFGTSPGGDFIGTDYSTGFAIVSTSFRENPLFGRRVSGEYTQCDVDSLADCLPSTNFTFQLSKADFRAVLGHARRMDPSLSTDPADYFVASYRFHIETYLDATIGMAISRVSLQIWPRVQ